MRRFILSHLLLPLAVLAAVIGIDSHWNLDLRISDVLYAWEGHKWLLKHYWLTDTVLHSGGLLLMRTVFLLLFVAFVLSWLRPAWRPYRRGLGYLTLTILTSVALVNGLKAISGVSCPWDISRYGGNSVLHSWLAGFTGAHGCFPAGHASGGYAWLALYFLTLVYRFELRYWALALSIGLGMLFGVSQQLRGAHFLSHDLVTFGICWFSSAIGFLLWFGQNNGSAVCTGQVVQNGCLNCGDTSEELTPHGETEAVHTFRRGPPGPS